MRVHTDRLILRDFQPQDALALHKIECQPEMVRYQDFEPRSLENATAYVEGAIKAINHPDRTYFEFAVCDSNNALLGRVGAVISEEAATVWFAIDPAHQGRGIATEAMRVLIEQLGHRRFLVECDPRNFASRRVAEKLGFELIHEKQNCFEIKGELVGSRLYQLIR